MIFYSSVRNKRISRIEEEKSGDGSGEAENFGAELCFGRAVLGFDDRKHFLARPDGSIAGSVAKFNFQRRSVGDEMRPTSVCFVIGFDPKWTDIFSQHHCIYVSILRPISTSIKLRLKLICNKKISMHGVKFLLRVSALLIIQKSNVFCCSTICNWHLPLLRSL